MKLKNQVFHHSHEEAEEVELWAISYGDMITLLLSFFVIFFSTDFKKKEEEKVDQHLIENFQFHAVKIDQKVKSILKTEQIKEIEKLLEKTRIAKINDRLLVTFDQMNFFDTAQTDPTKDGELLLNQLGQKLLPYAGQYKFLIKAFTDKRPVKGMHRYKDNMELSALRAISAVRVLQKAGIPLRQLEIAGYGEMDKLKNFIDEKQIEKLSQSEINDLSRTLVIIIKHDKEQSVL